MVSPRSRLSVLLVTFCIGNGDFYNQSDRVSQIAKYGINNHNLSGVQIWATAPEGNLTQGEVAFETLNGQLQFSSGFGVDVLTSLQISLRFSVKVITTKGWATQYPNGSWFGMAKEILDGNADIGIAKTSILPNRAKDLAYLVPTHGLGLYAFFVQPSSNSGRNIFLDPFEVKLWICVISTYLILITGIKALSYIARNFIELPSSDMLLGEDGGIWCFYTISQHGYCFTPKLICFRIALLSGVILGLVTYVGYSATLVSMFSTEATPIKSIKDLLKSTIRITIDANNQAAKTLTQTNDTESAETVSSLLRRRLTGRSKSHLITAAEGGLNVLNGRSAFLTFKDTFYTTSKNTLGAGDNEFCGRITAIPVTDEKFRSGLFVAKGSPLREPFNIKIICMYNSGLMKRFVTNYEEKYTPSCDPQQVRTTPSIDLPDVIFAFFGMGYGFCGGFGVFCIELVYFKYLQRRQRFAISEGILEVGLIGGINWH